MQRRLPLIVAGLAPLLVVLGLTWPLALNLGDWHMLTAWGDSHIWILDWELRHLLAGNPAALFSKTAEAGYPLARDLRSVGGGALFIFAPLRLFLSPLAAGTMTHLLVFSVSGLVTYGALGRLTQASPWSRAWLATAFACGPTVISTLGMGEISNTQAWMLPAFVWAADLLCPLDPSRPVRHRMAAVIAVVGLVGGLSSPYYTLALPLVSGGWALAALWRRRRGGLPAAVMLVGALFIGMLPVAAFYGRGAAGGTDSLVNPAPRALRGLPDGDALPDPSPIATPLDLVFSAPPDSLSPFQPAHVAYLGLPLLLLALLLAFLPGGPRPRGRALGLALVLGGAILALGPWLAWDGHYLSVAGRPLMLPVRLIELLGYPTRSGGLYFRYATVAQLGLVLVVAAGLARRRGAGAIAALICLLHVGDSVRATLPRWPLQAAPVADLEALTSMAPQTGAVYDVMAADGAVLELPLQGPTDGHFGQASVLRALFHRRPTTGILRDVRLHEHAARDVLDQARRDPDHFAQTLRQAGFRYVLLPSELARFSQPSDNTLRMLLGEPWHDGGLLIWDLGPTELKVLRRPDASGGSPGAR